MRLILISFALLLVFFLSSRMKLSHTEDCFTPSSVLHMWEFAVGICRGFFVYISESFFVYVSKSCLYGGKSFLYVCKTFWFVRFSLLTLFLLVIVVAIMGHRRTPMLWANLPEKYKTATSLDSFKTKIKTWKCETCFGRFCRTYQQNLGFYKKYFFQ